MHVLSGNGCGVEGRRFTKAVPLAYATDDSTAFYRYGIVLHRFNGMPTAR
jgi:hypothetical protein